MCIKTEFFLFSSDCVSALLNFVASMDRSYCALLLRRQCGYFKQRFHVLLLVDDRFPPDATVEFIFSNGPDKEKGDCHHQSMTSFSVPYEIKSAFTCQRSPEKKRNGINSV